jgi:hypothetical protein
MSTWVMGVKDGVGPSHGEVSRALGGPLGQGHGGRTHVDQG